MSRYGFQQSGVFVGHGDSEISALKIQLQKLNQQLSVMSRQLSAVDNEKASLHAQFRALESKHRVEISALEREVAERNRGIEQIVAIGKLGISERDKIISSLKEINAALQNDLICLDERVGFLKEENSALKKELHDLKAKMKVDVKPEHFPRGFGRDIGMFRRSLEGIFEPEGMGPKANFR